MKQHSIKIKNMVCPRCIAAVETILNGLNIGYTSVALGEVIASAPLSDKQQIQLNEDLMKLGLELLSDSKAQMISKIKAAIVDQIHYKNEVLNINFSQYLSAHLHQDYQQLSKAFSAVEGITIEKFITMQKIEKVKELLYYNELSLSEIAIKMNYSSVAHVSSQFKKETGMTPTAFKNQQKPGHIFLDTLGTTKY